MNPYNMEDNNSNYSSDDDDNNLHSNGYCHYNNNDCKTNEYFNISFHDKNINLKQKPSSNDLGIGAVVWDSSVIFIKYIEKNYRLYNYEKLNNKKVLELGSGCGLAGISLMLLGCKVTFTDLSNVINQLTEPNVLSIYKQTISQGSLVHQIYQPIITTLDWIEFSSSYNGSSNNFIHIDNPYDVILLTDCIFSCDIIDDLINVINICSNSRSTIICCYEIRDEEIINCFLVKLKKFYNYKYISSNQMNPEYQTNLVKIIIAKRKR